MSVGTISVKQYHKMIQAGILTTNDAVELLEGWLVERKRKSPLHCTIRSILADEFLDTLPEDELVVRIQCGLTLSTSEPEPDLTIVSGPDEKYFRRHPSPGDVALVVEIAEASLESDRTEKGRIYAGASLPEYWIVNLIDCVIEIYSQPIGGRRASYQAVQTYGRTSKIPLTLHGKSYGELPVKRILREPT